MTIVKKIPLKEGEKVPLDIRIRSKDGKAVKTQISGNSHDIVRALAGELVKVLAECRQKDVSAEKCADEFLEAFREDLLEAMSKTEGGQDD